MYAHTQAGTDAGAHTGMEDAGAHTVMEDAHRLEISKIVLGSVVHNKARSKLPASL